MQQRRRSAKHTNTAVAYVRVSTEEQHLGPDAQRHAVQEYADAHGLRIVAWCADLGVSGAMDPEDRPGMQDALCALREREAHVLLAAKQDRLARDVDATGWLRREVSRAGGRIVCADGTGNGTEVGDLVQRHVDALMGDMERRRISERTRAALAVKRRRGERVGRYAAIGYRLDDDGQQVPDCQERRLVQRVKRLRSSGLSYRACMDALHDDGHTWREGKAFTAPVVRRLALAAG